MKNVKKQIEKTIKELQPKKFRVYATRKELYCADIIATSAEEAIELANQNYWDYDFTEIDGTLETSIENAEECN